MNEEEEEENEQLTISFKIKNMEYLDKLKNKVLKKFDERYSLWLKEYVIVKNTKELKLGTIIRYIKKIDDKLSWSFILTGVHENGLTLKSFRGFSFNIQFENVHYIFYKKTKLDKIIDVYSSLY